MHGQCSTLQPAISISNVPTEAALDASYLYWTSSSANVLDRVAKSGGSPQTLAAIAAPQGIAVDSTDAYVTAPGSDAVWRIPIGGGTAALFASEPNHPHAVAVDATTVYWTSDARVMKQNKSGAGGIVQIAAPGSVSAIAVDGGYVYWAWNSKNFVHNVAREPTAGGAIEPLVTIQDNGVNGPTLDVVGGRAFVETGAGVYLLETGCVSIKLASGAASGVGVQPLAPNPTGEEFVIGTPYRLERDTVSVAANAAVVGYSQGPVVADASGYYYYDSNNWYAHPW